MDAPVFQHRLSLFPQLPLRQRRGCKSKLHNFADCAAKVTTYLAMKPGRNGQKDTLLPGIPEMVGIMMHGSTSVAA